MMLLFEIGLVVGFLAVASNPSPYYAALSLVVSAGVGCLILVYSGASFLSLVLFLVYLGGMMVVFAYSAALVAEPYPEAWGSGSVIMYLVGYCALLEFWYLVVGEVAEVVFWDSGLTAYVGDWYGASMLLCWGGGLLLVGGWALLLTLFAVLGLVWGHYQGVLRTV